MAVTVTKYDVIGIILGRYDFTTTINSTNGIYVALMNSAHGSTSNAITSTNTNFPEVSVNSHDTGNGYTQFNPATPTGGAEQRRHDLGADVRPHRSSDLLMDGTRVVDLHTVVRTSGTRCATGTGEAFTVPSLCQMTALSGSLPSAISLTSSPTNSTGLLMHLSALSLDSLRFRYHLNSRK